jgi:hypothetical protein
MSSLENWTGFVLESLGVISWYVPAIYLLTRDGFDSDVKIFGVSIAKQNITSNMIASSSIFAYVTLARLIANSPGKSFYWQLLESSLMIIVTCLVLTFVFASRAYSKLLAGKELGSSLSKMSLRVTYGLITWCRMFAIGVAIYQLFKYLHATSWNFTAVRGEIALSIIILGALNFLVVLLEKAELRENGVFGGYFLLKWDKILKYKLESEDRQLHLQHSSFWPFAKHIQLSIPSENVDEVEALLNQYLSALNSE